MEIIIEEISRGHKLLGRHKFLTNKINIGRGYQNDIILSDPHVCPEHVSLQWQDDHWRVNDQHTVNGTFLGDSKQNADQHIIKSGDVLQLGKTKIRLLFPNHPVEKSISFSPFERLIDFMKHPVVLGLSISLFAFVTGFMFYLNQAAEVNFTQYIVRAVGATLAFALWPGLVALISHLTKNDARVFTQLGICFVLFNVMWLNDVLESVVQFNLSSNWSIMWLLSLIPLALAFCLFWLNCYVGFQMSHRRRMTVAISLTALMFGGSYMVKLSNQPEFNYRPIYDATVMTPTFRFAPSSNVDKFLHDSSKLFAQASKAISKEKQ
jgi:RsiW-degrading membrane proteinase PrsW (M82 family)